MRKYIIYDGRATDNTDEAQIMEVCNSLQEAVKEAPDYGEGCCIWSYDVKGKNLINERFEKIVFSK